MVAAPLLNEVLSLPLAEREELFDALHDSFSPPIDAELDASMAAEADARCAAIDRGEMELLDGPTIMAELKRRFAP